MKWVERNKTRSIQHLPIVDGTKKPDMSHRIRVRGSLVVEFTILAAAPSIHVGVSSLVHLGGLALATDAQLIEIPHVVCKTSSIRYEKSGK